MAKQTNDPKQQKLKRKQKQRRGHPILRFIGTLILVGIITGAMLLCMAAMYIKFVVLPDADLALTDYNLNLTTMMYYTNKDTEEPVIMQSLHATENRVWVEYEDIPQNLINAAVAIEDKRFYEHGGVDWIRTVNGVLLMFTGQDIQGGSTLTQQLIKNLTTEDDVTVKRKITEIFRALEFEKDNEKEVILEWYLNYIYLGEMCNGVYTASYAYFDKNVKDLTLAECASLIGITNNPSLYNPYRNREANKTRQINILWAMYEQGYITEAEYEEAKAQELHFVRGEDESRPQVTYSWYEDAVITQVIADLEEKQGYSNKVAVDRVYSGGLQIYTCYNPDIQAAVDAVYTNRDNLSYTSKTGQKIQSAITIVENSTGNVVALAGGIGQKTESRSHNRATQSYRPPGSAIKPVAVYAPALDRGLITTSTIVNDSPYEKSWPINSYGSYRGNMTVREAMRISANTVAVKVLAKLTPEASYEFMTGTLGFERIWAAKTVNGQNFTDIALAPLALGGLTEGTSTYEMAASYSMFAREGVYLEPSLYTKVLDSEGNVLLERNTEGVQAIKPTTAYYITDMLQNVVSSGTGTLANFRGADIAGKTGTTSSKKDLWFVGYTPQYTAAVWTGYDQQEAMNLKNNPSAILFRQVMERIHAFTPYMEFPRPAGVEMTKITVCAESGMRATKFCPSTTSSSVLSTDIPGSCTTHTTEEEEPEETENPPETETPVTPDPQPNPQPDSPPNPQPNPQPTPQPNPPPEPQPTPQPDPPPDTGDEPDRGGDTG